jgi:hypothetical protein
MKEERSAIDFHSLEQFLQHIGSFDPDFTFLGDYHGSLYHYTDLGGLAGIIQSQDIWLTNSRYSNDDEEITYGYKIVKEVIEEQLKLANSPRVQEFLDNLFKLVNEPTDDGIYTCSFCLQDNLLSQWRGYGANGTGVSLAFDPKKFYEVLGTDSPKGLMRLWKVFYEEEKQKDIIKEAINFFVDPRLSIDEKTRRTFDAIRFFIPTFKHAGFVEEEECRMIFTPPPDFDTKPKFRVARGMLIPYYTLQDLVTGNNSAMVYELPVTGVRIGPSTNRALNRESVRMLLDKNQLTTVTIEDANIPFRG